MSWEPKKDPGEPKPRYMKPVEQPEGERFQPISKDVRKLLEELRRKLGVRD